MTKKINHQTMFCSNVSCHPEFPQTLQWSRIPLALRVRALVKCSRELKETSNASFLLVWFNGKKMHTKPTIFIMEVLFANSFIHSTSGALRVKDERYLSTCTEPGQNCG